MNLPNISREEVRILYWGTEGTPDQWKEPEEICDQIGVLAEEVHSLLGIFGVRRRAKEDYLLKAVWDCLADHDLSFGEDFKYQHRENQYVDFAIHDRLCFLFDGKRTADEYEETIHNGPWEIVLLPRLMVTTDQITVIVEGVLERYGYKKKEDEGEEGSEIDW